MGEYCHCEAGDVSCRLCGAEAYVTKRINTAVRPFDVRRWATMSQGIDKMTIGTF